MDNVKIPSVNLEEMIIAYSIKHTMFLEQILPHLSTSSYKTKSYFQDPKNQMVFNLISRWYGKYKSVPNLKEAKSIIENINEDDDIKLYCNTLLNKYYIEDVSTYNDEFIKEETKKFIKQAKMIEAFMLAQVDLEKNDYNHLVEQINEANISIFENKKNVSSISSTTSIDLITELLDKEQNIKKISTGYPDFDKALDDGFRPSNLYIFAAISGGGKSILLLQFALNAVKKGNRVLYISLEMDETTIQNRINLNLLPETYTDKQTFNLTYKLNKQTVCDDIKNAFTSLSGELVINYADNLGITCNEFKKLLNKEKFDMLVVDYMGIMNTNDGKNQEQAHFKYKQITEELREIAKVYGIPVITANQLNADGYKSKSLSLTNVSYSAGISYTADFVAAINPDGDVLTILKSRNGETASFSILINKPKFIISSITKLVEPIDDKEFDKCLGKKDE